MSDFNNPAHLFREIVSQEFPLHHPNYYEIQLSYLRGGWMIYQCIATPQVFQSTNYKLNAFSASNGVVIASKNSPVLVNERTVFLHGAYREFDFKPSLFFVDNEARYQQVGDLIKSAMIEMENHFTDPQFFQLITRTAKLLADNHNPNL